MIVYNGVPIQGVYRNGSACPVYYNQHRVWPEPAPPQRYEVCLFSATGNSGESAGTIKYPVSAFDSIIIGTRFATYSNGGNYYELKYTGGAAVFPTYLIALSSYFIVHNKIQFNDSTLTWSQEGGSAFSAGNYRMPCSATGTMSAWSGNTGPSRQVVYEIWGVKYQ